MLALLSSTQQLANALKDSLTLCNLVRDSFPAFNDLVSAIKEKLGCLFPLQRENLPRVEIENMQSLGVDGACISPVKMVNNRVKQFNPRCITNWCGSHKTNIVATDAGKENILQIGGNALKLIHPLAVGKNCYVGCPRGRY